MTLGEEKDIIFLMESHEHNGCRILEFKGHTQIFV
jgi:hypothetical protein